MDKAQIIQLLATNDKAVARAVAAINHRQTATEQNAEQTINRNGEGFTPADARMGASMAKFFARNGYLSPKQIAYWRKPNVKGVMRIAKYAGQLLEIAAEKAKAKEILPVTPKVSADVGNLLEEQMVLEEQLSALQEGAYGSGPEQEVAMDNIYDRMMQIKEQLEEIARCEYKMARDGMLAQ